MKRSRRLLTPALLSLAALAFSPAVSSACSVCMGATPKTGEAINGAIFLMLGFIFAILGGIGAFIYNLAKRARSPLPSHDEFSQVMTAQEETKSI